MRRWSQRAQWIAHHDILPAKRGDRQIVTLGQIAPAIVGGEQQIGPRRQLDTADDAARVRNTARRTAASPSTRASEYDVALAARLAPGDSGAPVVDEQGRVTGVAFAIDPGGKPVAYALTNRTIKTLLPITSAPVSTGPCISI